MCVEIDPVTLKPFFNFEKLHEVTYHFAICLDKGIDVNYYPFEQCRTSNMRNRPISIGGQGLADAFVKMRFPADSDDAFRLNAAITETMLHAALTASKDRAIKAGQDQFVRRQQELRTNIIETRQKIDHLKSGLVDLDELTQDMQQQRANLRNNAIDLDATLNKIKSIERFIAGHAAETSAIKNLEASIVEMELEIGSKTIDSVVGLPYPSFHKNGGAPLAQEHPKFHWELQREPALLSGLWDWEALRAEIKVHGVRNSLLIGFMPTAGTAQLLKNSEGAELRTSNVFVREVKSGAFACASRALQDELISLDLWNDDMKDEIFANCGSIQLIDNIPDHVKALFKTVYEVPIEVQINMAAARGVFIDQSESFNINSEDASFLSMSEMHFQSWRMQRKTGSYYFRKKQMSLSQKYTISPELEERVNARILADRAQRDAERKLKIKARRKANRARDMQEMHDMIAEDTMGGFDDPLSGTEGPFLSATPSKLDTGARDPNTESYAGEKAIVDVAMALSGESPAAHKKDEVNSSEFTGVCSLAGGGCCGS